LSGGNVLAVEAAVNILRVRALVGVLPLFFNQWMPMVVMIMMVVMVVMIMMMVMVIVMMVVIVWLTLLPGSPGHPQGDQHDQYPRDQLEPGLRRMRIPAPAKP